MNNCFKVTLSFGFLFTLLLLGGCGGSDQSSRWSIEANGVAWVQRDLAGGNGDPVAEKYFYGITNERVYIAARLFPQGQTLTVEDVEAAISAPVQHYGFGQLGLSMEEPGTLEAVGAIEFDSAQSLILSSGLLRSVGGAAVEQPYGDLVLRTVIEEETYEVERRSGFPLFGDSYTEQVGDGVVRLELVDGDRVLFTLRDEYVENSSDFTAMFTPDGRYVLLVLPDDPESAAAQLPGAHRLVLVGDLPINRNKTEIVAELSLKGEAKAAFEAQKLKEQQYRDGLITAAEFYGEVYLKAHRRVMECDDVRSIIGDITSLQVHDSILNFGQPETVGKVFTFDYVAAGSSGEIQIVVLDPEHALTEFNAYRSYLESIDIRSDSGVRYANCPQNSG